MLGGVAAIAVGGDHSCALMTTGGVRCWGRNIFGQLSDGTHTDRTTPPTSDVLSGVTAVAAGSEHTCALMASGGIRCWGLNSSGCLGTTPPDDTTPKPLVGICQ